MQSGGRRCGSVAAIVAPSYLQALHIAAETDLVAFVPSRLASLLVHRLNLMIVKPPFNPGVDEQFLFYPATAQRDRGSLLVSLFDDEDIETRSARQTATVNLRLTRMKVRDRRCGCPYLLVSR